MIIAIILLLCWTIILTAWGFHMESTRDSLRRHIERVELENDNRWAEVEKHIKSSVPHIDCNRQDIDQLKRQFDAVRESVSRLHKWIESLEESTRMRAYDLESAYASRFGVSVQDVLRQKRESAEQEKAYYAWKEQG